MRPAAQVHFAKLKLEAERTSSSRPLLNPLYWRYADRFNVVDLLVKTPKGLECTAASYISELFPGATVVAKPAGMAGLVLVDGIPDRAKAAEEVKRRVPEAEYVLAIDAEARAELDEIARAAAEVAKREIGQGETFAVRTVRRGEHPFTSIDVNVRAGAAVKEATGADVDLMSPDKVVYIEIINDKAFIAVERDEEYKKARPGKRPVLGLLRRLSIIQMPYLGPLDAARTMGIRIGRAVQTFEVGELIVAPKERVGADELMAFLEGVREGIESRYEIQRRAYGRPVHKVPVFVQDLYQLVRERGGEPLVATSTRGGTIGEISGKLGEVLSSKGRINVLIGSREGLPTGVLRASTLILDLSAGVTISTDYASVAAVIALITWVEMSRDKDKYLG